jgi:hypothetical protein
MSQPRVARQRTNIVLKLIAAALGGDLFARFGVPLPPIVDALPTELPQLKVGTQLVMLRKMSCERFWRS